MSYNILDYLEQSAEKYPQKIAFSDEVESISFSDLRLKARRVGSALAKMLSPRTPVAFYMDKSVNTIIGFLGAVYAGCFYVLLDLQQPIARLNGILQILQPGILITGKADEKAVNSLNVVCPVKSMESLKETEESEILLKAVYDQSLDIDPLYCNFTSGSTGVPKGVVVSHRSVLDFIDRFVPLFGITEQDVIGNQAPLDFDVSVKDIYSGLKTGARVELIPRSFFSIPVKLMDHLAQRRITTLIWAVSALCIISTMKGLEYCKPEAISKVMFSGEVMPPRHLSYWKRFYPDALYVNLYGPTEITCNCTYHIIDREYASEEVIPMGKAFPNEKVFLLDDKDQLVCEPNVSGELCVSGTALALGYYNDTQRTAAVFTQNPLNRAYMEPIYRTGDLVRYGEDGLLYYVGRKDFQIKHMGHRIELGEIEAAMSSAENVERACVLYFEAKQKIAAFYVGTAEIKELMGFLKQRLPQYMVPNSFVKLAQMPVTKNGKIDRAQLRNIWLEHISTEGDSP